MILFLLILFFTQISPVLAAGEFSINQNISYQIDQQGNALVGQEIELVNNYSEIYPKEYQVTLSSKDITNITGSDNVGDIVKNINKQNDTSVIDIKFNQANVGKNKTTKFKLNYSLPKLATQKGNTWEIPLPDHQDLQAGDNININLIVPSNFGSLSFNSVRPKNIISLNDQTQISFDSDNVKNKKILLIFGNYQVFDFDFKYFVENPTNHSAISEIAIPPQTDNQKIIYQEINPLPQNIRIDTDGNWLAQYQLSANQSLEINVSGQAKIIHSNITQSNIDINQYLKSTEFWPTSDSSIIQIANTLKSPKDIYNYVVNTLNYNYDNINSAQRKGAINALLSPNESLCTEFTDLFITLARSRGIPAREVEGFAYTNNSKIKPINTNADVLHAWPQYYDSSKKTWISIDPTWGKTTNGIDFFNDLDPNHFAFVFHGINSQNPPPPGAYKNNQNIKTVKIEFSQKEIKAQYLPLKIEIINDKFYQSPKIKIFNPNYNSISQVEISLPILKWQKNITQIPPISSINMDLPTIPLIKSILPTFYKLKININSADFSSYQISVNQPKFYLNLIIFTALIVTLIGIGGIIFKRKK